VEVVKKDRNAHIQVGTKSLHTYLGAIKFRYGKVEGEQKIGVATGLAWTEMGGEILATEVTIMPGKGQLLITGKLGDACGKNRLRQPRATYVRGRST
jgi:ATP-dependent Lon protease